MLPLLLIRRWWRYSCCQSQTPNTALPFIFRDFNYTSQNSTLSTFSQYVKCNNRDNTILDLSYAKVCILFTPLPALGPDNNLVHLLPVHKSVPQKQPATTKLVRRLSDESLEALKDWEVLCEWHGEGIGCLTLHYISFCVENTMVTCRVQCFFNKKPGDTLHLRLCLRKKKGL